MIFLNSKLGYISIVQLMWVLEVDEALGTVLVFEILKSKQVRFAITECTAF